jgi:hypothetical protein
MDVAGDDVGERVVALVSGEARFDFGVFTGPEAVTAVEHVPFVENDWISQPVLGDVVS